MRRANSTDTARQAGPTMGGGLARKLLVFAAREGLDARALAGAHGLDARALAEPGARVALEAVYGLVEAIAGACEVAAGLRFTASLGAEDFDALGYLMVTSATIGGAIDRFIAHQRLYTEGERYELVPANGGAILRFTPWGPPRPAHAWMADIAFGDVLGAGQALLGRPLAIGPVRLRRPRPADPRSWQAALGDVEFGALVDEAVLPAATLAIALPAADAGMHAIFARVTREQLARLPSDLSLGSRVRALIGERLADGAPELAELADALGLAPRTLQRRLSADGDSVHGLVEAVRRARAAELLATMMPLAEVSQRLGYAEPSVFFRAFRRWTGETPQAHRRRHGRPAKEGSEA
jgi:AraC-like DNA-binding protein